MVGSYNVSVQGCCRLLQIEPSSRQTCAYRNVGHIPLVQWFV